MREHRLTHAPRRTDLAAVGVAGGGCAEELAEQLVGAVDQMDNHEPAGCHTGPRTCTGSRASDRAGCTASVRSIQ